MRAMILAAGYGTRLWPLTVDRTKPAIPFLGRPLAGYVAEYLARYGYGDIVVNLHHRPESVREALGDGRRFGVRLQYVLEPEILGTSGALDNARPLLEDGTFVVVNGKIVTDIDLAAALETHRKTDALATLVLRPNSSRERFSIMETQDGMVTRFGGMPDPAIQGSPIPLMFTGIQILEPRIFSYIPRGVFSHSTTEVYPKAIAAGERIAAHIAEGMWYEVSTLQRYLDISLALLADEGRTIQTGAGGCIAPGASVEQAVLWDRVIVSDGARVRHAVLADGVEVADGETIENAVVVRAELVQGIDSPAKAPRGTRQGDKFVVPLAQ
jgi:NDP-sugar pyrophosphorylase family protein